MDSGAKKHNRTPKKTQKYPHLNAATERQKVAMRSNELSSKKHKSLSSHDHCFGISSSKNGNVMNP
jgi:hypothetical protein